MRHFKALLQDIIDNIAFVLMLPGALLLYCSIQGRMERCPVCVSKDASLIQAPVPAYCWKHMNEDADVRKWKPKRKKEARS